MSIAKIKTNIGVETSSKTQNPNPRVRRKYFAKCCKKLLILHMIFEGFYANSKTNMNQESIVEIINQI